jgi:hypothetical protein
MPRILVFSWGFLNCRATASRVVCDTLEMPTPWKNIVAPTHWVFIQARRHGLGESQK